MERGTSSRRYTCGVPTAPLRSRRVREAIFGVCSTTKAARTGGDNWLLLRIHVRPANIQQTPELLIPMGTGDAGDCALLAPCRPAAASAAHYTRRLSNVCAVPWLFLHGPRVAPTTSMRIPLYRPCKKQHLRSPFFCANSAKCKSSCNRRYTTRRE